MNMHKGRAGLGTPLTMVGDLLCDGALRNMDVLI